MPLSQGQINDAAAGVAAHIFQGVAHTMGGTAVATANVNWADLQAAVSAVDTAFDTTLTNATAAVGGGTSIINYLASTIPAPTSGGTAQQKTILACYVLLKRAGLI